MIKTVTSSKLIIRRSPCMGLCSHYPKGKVWNAQQQITDNTHGRCLTCNRCYVPLVEAINGLLCPCCKGRLRIKLITFRIKKNYINHFGPSQMKLTVFLAKHYPQGCTMKHITVQLNISSKGKLSNMLMALMRKNIVYKEGPLHTRLYKLTPTGLTFATGAAICLKALAT